MHPNHTTHESPNTSCVFCGKPIYVKPHRILPQGNSCSRSCVYKSHTRPSLESDFWSKVEKTESGCWLWIGGIQHGYGEFSLYHGRMIKAHRFSYELAHGPIPDGMCICHKCDVCNCVNPSHLFLGTQADNVKDMNTKGRAISLRGEQNPNAKLTENDVREIRRLRGSGMEHDAIGKMFNVSSQLSCSISVRKSWKHLL